MKWLGCCCGRLTGPLALVIVLSYASAQNTVTERPTSLGRGVNIPPIIVKQPRQKMSFVVDESIALPCEATGEPRPVYTWYWNGELFDASGNDGRVAIQPGVGTLIFARPVEKDEAIYQCNATNVVGTSVSVKIDLRRAVLGKFPVKSTRRHRPQLGQSLSLSCIPPKSWPAPQIFWAITRQGDTFDPIDLTDRLTMDPEGNLHFANILSTDYQQGRKYACYVQNKVMRSFQHGSYQTIDPQGDIIQNYPPRLLYAYPKTQVALRGQVWRIKCIFAGNPTPRVAWRREGKDMPSRYREDSFGQELVVENVQFEDAGSYECEGINEVAQVPIRRSFDLSVQSAPFWIRSPDNVDGAENDKAEFFCQAAGLPEPSIEWLINGVPLSKVQRDERRVVGKNQLTFFNVSKDDAQVIQCNATNKHGYIFANAYLNVLAEKPFIQIPPKQDHKVAEGQDVRLTCQVFGSPKPLVVWRKQGEQLTGGRFKVEEDGHLLIQDVLMVDAGTYTCTATNKFDTVSATGSLIVRRRTRIQTAPLQVMVYEGTEAKFTCTATTDPEEMDNLIIEWKKDGELIDYRSAQRIFKNDMDNSLTISGTYHKDTGKYSCVASNGLDESEAGANLVVQDHPDPPGNLRVKCQDRDRKAELFWQPGKENYAPILNFIIQYNTSFTPDTWIDIETNVSVNRQKIDISLSPWGNYTFRILARNKIGISPPSEHTRNVCRTDPAIPEKNPENVIGEGDLPNNLVIYWTPMPKIDQNGPGFTYIISWQRKDVENARVYTERINRPWQYHHVVAEEQETFKPFWISVKASNSVGETLASPERVIGWSGEDEPLVVPQDIMVLEDTVTGTQAILTWTQVDTSPEAIRGFFRGYRVQFWRTSDGPESMRERDLILNKTSQYPRPREKRQVDENDMVTFRLTHLPPYADITVQIRVLNKYYAGQASQAVYFRTHEDLPGPPAMFDVVARGSTHFELVWDRPSEPNGNVLTYSISYQIITGLNLGLLQYAPTVNASEKVLRARLTGLRPETDYRVYLTASTRKGHGEAIFLDVQTTSAGPPSPPTFSIMDVGEDWATVSWVPSRSGNPGSVFYCQYRERGQYHWMHSPDEENDYSITLSELDPGTTYQLRVVAKNGAQDEAQAEWQAFMTGGIAPGRAKLATAGWFYGIFVCLILIIIFLVVFIILKRIRDEWWEKKEQEIEEQTRQVLAEEAALQMGILNEYARTQSHEMIDTSHASLHGFDYKEPVVAHEGEDDDDDDDDDDETFDDDVDDHGKGFDKHGVPHGAGYRPPKHAGQVDPYAPPSYPGYHPGYTTQHQPPEVGFVGEQYQQPPYAPQQQYPVQREYPARPLYDEVPGDQDEPPEGGFVQDGQYQLQQPDPQRKEDSAMSSFV